jgi:hypothetical protein
MHSEKGGNKANQWVEQGFSTREIALQVHYACIFILCVLSANNIELCLGYK